MSSFITESTHCVVCGSSEGRAVASGYDYIYSGSSQISTAWSCTSCRHVYLNPRPVADEIAILYPNNYASFSGKFVKNTSLIARMKEYTMIRRIRKYLESLPQKKSRFLDIGCGDGQLLEAVKRLYPNIEVHGLDWKFEPELRFRLEQQGIILHESMLENVNLPESSYDLITMHQLIEHLWEPRYCLKMVHHILSPQGRLILTTPDIDGYDRHLFMSGLWGGYYFPRHLNLFSRVLLERLLIDCGLAVEESRSLVAPIIWCYSFKAWLKVKFPKFNRLHNICDVHNIPLMIIFSVIDIMAMYTGMRTSNQLLTVRPATNIRQRT